MKIKKVDPRPWAIYARLSRKKPVSSSGRRTRRASPDDVTVTRQVEFCKEWAKENNLPIAPEHIYIDNHFSAWRKKGGKRPDFRRMMEAAERGELAGIIVWKLDRFTRSPIDLEHFLSCADEQGMGIGGPMAGRLDLTTAAGIKQARDFSSVAAHDSDSTSERVRAALAEARLDGDMIGGPRIFGFMYSSDWEQHPEEAPLIRDAARRLLAGDGTTATELVAEWNAAGILTAGGHQWRVASFNRMIALPRMGGRVTHANEIVGKTDAEPILDEGTYGKIQALMAGRRRGRRSSGQYELSGIIRCGRCDNGNTLSGKTVPGHYGRKTMHVTRQYACRDKANGGCAQGGSLVGLETMAQRLALRLLRDPKVRSAIGERNVLLNDRRAELRALIDQHDEELAILERRRAAKDIRQRGYQEAKKVHDAAILDAENELDQLGPEEAQTDIDPAILEGLAADFEELGPAERNRLYRRLKIEMTLYPWTPGTPKRWTEERATISSPLEAVLAA